MDFLHGRYLSLYSNRIRFDHQLYGPESIVKESEFHWFPIELQFKTEVPFKLRRTELRLQDYLFDMDDITQLEDTSVFRLQQTHSRPDVIKKQGSDQALMRISIEMSMTLTVIERNGDTLLDMFSAIGGLEAALFSTFSLAIRLLNLNSLRSYVAEKLFSEVIKNLQKANSSTKRSAGRPIKQSYCENRRRKI